MLLTQSTGPSERFTSAHVDRLIECDDLHGYSECGWYNVAGYKGEHRNRVIHVHANSFEDVRNAFARKGYLFDGSNLHPMTEEERRDFFRKDDEDSDYSFYGSYRR